jgi:V-type H+-transporting ATPase subunit C
MADVVPLSFRMMLSIDAIFDSSRSGSLAARDLTNLVPTEDVTETEYLTTLLVVVPKNEYKTFQAKYESLASFVVPRSAKCVRSPISSVTPTWYTVSLMACLSECRMLYEDGDSGLFRVILFKKVVDDFKGKAREFKYVFFFNPLILSWNMRTFF